MVGDPIFLTNSAQVHKGSLPLFRSAVVGSLSNLCCSPFECSAQYGNSTNPEGACGNGDACYTLIRPVNQK